MRMRTHSVTAPGWCWGPTGDSLAAKGWPKAVEIPREVPDWPWRWSWKPLDADDQLAA